MERNAIERMHAITETGSEALKKSVSEFWNAASCGEIYMQGSDLRTRLEQQAAQRYQLEPFIFEFAKFHEGRGKDVLEIGVGLGADHVHWATSRPRFLTAVDLTARAIHYTRARLALSGLSSNLEVADAEHLPLRDDSFDIVYSWGVLHHTPRTDAAINEVHRVLRPGGTARIMIYNRDAIAGYLLWVRYGLMAGHPGRKLDDIYFHHLESEGTKAYTVEQARALFHKFSSFRAQVRLSAADLLTGAAGSRHQGALLSLARAVWPRWLIQRSFEDHGLFLMIEVTK